MGNGVFHRCGEEVEVGGFIRLGLFLETLSGGSNMMLGEYPCCGEPLMIGVPETTPAFAKENCPNCGAVVWHKFSRVDPESWIEKAFLAAFKVDDETKTITRIEVAQ